MGNDTMVQRKKDQLEDFINKKLKLQEVTPKTPTKPKTTVEHLKAWNGKTGGKIGGKGFLIG
jgi:hypothetical protein